MSVLRNISYFLAASVLAKPLGILLSFALAKALGPADFGMWVTLMLIITYCPIAHLGTLETLIKEVSFSLGKKDHVRVREVEDSVMGFVVLATAFVVGLALLALVALPFTSLPVNPVLVALMLLTAAATYFSSYYYYRSTAYENFKLAGASDFLRAVLALLLVGGLVWQWGLLGAVAGYLLHELALCLVNRHYSIQAQGKVGLSFRRDLLVAAIRTGFPITLLWWILTLTGTVDRVVLGSLLGPLAVGHYGLGISLATIVYLLPIIVGRVLYPKVNKQFGENGGKESMNEVVLAPTLTLGILIANVQLALLAFMPFLYIHLLPKYQPGLLAGLILILGSYFGSLMRNGANYLIAAGQERVFLKYIVVTLVLNVIADVGLVKAGLGIAGIALGTSLAGFLLTTLVWRRVLIGLGSHQQNVWIALFELYWPGIMLGGLCIGLRLIYPTVFQTVSVISVVTGLGLFILLNGLLYLSPVYRRQMIAAGKVLVRLKEGLAARAGLAGTRN